MPLRLDEAQRQLPQYADRDVGRRNLETLVAAPPAGATAASLLHVEQFNVEHQRCVGRDDAARAALAVAEFRRDHE